MRFATLGALVLVAATALVSSGCRGSLDPVAQAATRTSDVSTLRFTMKMTLRMPGLPDGASVEATGAIDSQADRMTMTMDLSRVAALAGEPGALGRMTMIEDGPSMYMSVPELARLLPGGKSWVRVDLAQAAKTMGVDLSSLTGAQSDPRMTLAQLQGAGNVVEIGTDEVRGVATTRYNVLLDLRQGLDRLDGDARRAMELLLDRLESAGNRYVPADAWVDGDGFLRRFKVTIPGYLGEGSSFGVTMDLFGFGSAVAIAVPPADQVADLTGALPGTLGG